MPISVLDSPMDPNNGLVFPKGSVAPGSLVRLLECRQGLLEAALLLVYQANDMPGRGKRRLQFQSAPGMLEGARRISRTASSLRPCAESRVA